MPESIWAFWTKLLCQKYVIFGYEHKYEFFSNHENLDPFPKFFFYHGKKES